MAVTVAVVGGVAAVVGTIKLVINPDRIVSGGVTSWNLVPTSDGMAVVGRF